MPTTTPPASGTRASQAIPWIVACALFMQNLDSTAVTTAIPSMARSLGVTPVQLSTTISAYVLAMAVFLPACGWAADRFGSRKVFASAILLFTASSVICGLTDSLVTLVIARIAQGIGGSMMVPVGRLLLLRSVSRDQLVTAMARTTMPGLVGPALGPLIGGALSTYASWRWIFLVNVPIGMVGLVMTLRLIPDDRHRQAPAPFDLPGFLLVGTALGTLVFALEAASKSGSSVWTLMSLLALGILASVLYLRRIASMAAPILDHRVFRHPSFMAGIGGGTLFRIGASAIPFLVPLLLQIGFGMSAFVSGAVSFANAAGAVISKPFTLRLLRRVSYRPLLIGSALLSGLMLALFLLLRPSTPMAVIFALLLVGGVIRSAHITCANTLAYADVPHADTAQANTLANVMQQLAVSCAVALAAGLLHIGQLMFGDPHLGWADFSLPFAGIALLSAASALFYLPLAADAGEDMRGEASN